MKLVTSKQIQEIDLIAVKHYKIPSLKLMENAGRAVADIIKERTVPKDSILIIVGRGNNGGDGLVAGRYLIEAGYKVAFALMSAPDELSPDAKTNWGKLKSYSAKVIFLNETSNLREFKEALHDSDYVIDAILGTGLNSEVRGLYSKVIDEINMSTRPVISVDIPSDLSADTGSPLGNAIFARLTVTFGLPKIGHVIPPGPEHVKELKVVNIGFPEDLINSYETNLNIITPDLFKDEFGERAVNSHKGDFGHVLILAGSVGKMGAGWLASKAALRSGAGLVTYGIPETAFKKFDPKFAEVMVEPIADKKKGHFVFESLENIREVCHKKNTVALGPGIGTHRDTEKAVVALEMKLNLPLVIDADGINNIAKHLKVLDRRHRDTVLTPHPGEMSRLTGLDTKTIGKDRINVTRKFSMAHKVYTVLKGNRSIVATPTGDVFINTTGNPGMATAGTGDALTGMITAFMARMPTLTAVLAGVYLHGLAGDLAAGKMGEVGMISSDLIENIPDAIKIIRQWK